MGIFKRDKLRFKKFGIFEERAFDQVCTNVHKIIKKDFTFDYKHRQNGDYKNTPNDFTHHMYTELIIYSYYIKKKNNRKDRLNINFYKFFIGDQKDIDDFNKIDVDIPHPLNDKKYYMKLVLNKLEYPASYLKISSENADIENKCIKFEYQEPTNKFYFNAQLSKKCENLIKKETTNFLKRIFS